MATLGVVIPTLNEAELLPGILGDLRLLEVPHDVVVADGGSDDSTREVAAAFGARLVKSPRGRGTQLRAGAQAVSGEWLCFLPADVRMPQSARTALDELVLEDCRTAAVWRFAIDEPGTWFRLVEFGARLRDLIGGLPYGDQGLVVRRDLYDVAGGYPAIPIMEDVALIRAIRRHSRVSRLEAPLRASAAAGGGKFGTAVGSATWCYSRRSSWACLPSV